MRDGSPSPRPRRRRSPGGNRPLRSPSPPTEKAKKKIPNIAFKSASNSNSDPKARDVDRSRVQSKLDKEKDKKEASKVK